MATHEIVDQAKWIPIPSTWPCRYLAVHLESQTSADTATIDLFGSSDGGGTSVVLRRADTLADAANVGLTCLARKPSASSYYDTGIVVALEGCSAIYINETGAPSGTNRYVLAPV
jgi:hypothetical protein